MIVAAAVIVSAVGSPVLLALAGWQAWRIFARKALHR